MANYGLSRPWIARLNTEDGTYSDAFCVGEAITTSVTPEFVEGSLHADNRQTEYIKKFKRATVAAGTSRLPIEAKKVIFGHRVEDNKEEISSADDNANYVGYAFISREMINGAEKYIACLLLKVKFTEGEDGYETSGDSITFKTPNISGNALSIGITYENVKKGDWRVKSPLFDTEEEADEWIQAKFGVKEKCATPKASVRGGEYQEAQSVVLTTATTGAKITYTTDGTTPSLTNGTQYKSAIPVTATMAIRAIAHKDGTTTSDELTAEYFIKTVTEP